MEFNSARFWKDAAWLATGSIAAQGISVVAMPLLTRFYSPAAFALQATFLQIVGFVWILQTLRLEYFVHLPKENKDAIALVQAVMVLGGFWCVIVSPFIWFWRHDIAAAIGSIEIAPWLVAIPMSAWLLAIAVAFENLWQRHGEFRKSSFAESAGKLSYVGSACAGAILHYNNGGLILATAVGAIGKIGYLGLGLRGAVLRATETGESRSDARNIRDVAASFRTLSWSTASSHIIQAISGLVPIMFIGKCYGAESLGQFVLVNSTIGLPTALVGTSIGKVYYQRAAALWGNNQMFRDLWMQTFKKLVLIGVPIFAIISICASEAYPKVFGRDWVVAGQIGSIMSLNACLAFVSAPMDRSCFIVSAHRYIISWNILRLAGAICVVILANRFSLSLTRFVVMYTSQLSIIYLIDIYAGYVFSHSRGGQPTNPGIF